MIAFIPQTHPGRENRRPQAAAPTNAHPAALTVFGCTLSIRLRRSGDVVPWIGPAVRGIVAGRLKARVCRHSPAERERDWVHCRGCPHLQECPYGRLYEPAPPANGLLSRDRLDGTPPVVIAPYYPLPQRIEAGAQIPLRLVAVGAGPDDIAPLWGAIADAGRAPGIGPDHIRFDLLADQAESERYDLGPADFPARPEPGGRIPRFGLGLTSPLFLRVQGRDGRRRANTRPRFGDLFRPALGTVRTLFAMNGVALAADFDALMAAADRVETIETCYQPFEQPKWSSRTDTRTILRGVTGGGLFADVPMNLLPWMLWGGRLHVGNHRVAGAGGWRIVLD